jgi:rhomboid-like protein
LAAQILKPYGSDKKPEKGLRFQKGELGHKTVRDIFGPRPPPTAFANRLLRVLHGRRHDGTLDLPLPDDVQSELDQYPYAVEDGLHWLRKAYPIDEDAAILARIEREEHALERDNPAELLQRGQDLGLYRGPQSGHYHAELGEKEGDVYGVSELDKIRAESEARAAREEEELQAQIDERMARHQTEQSKALAERPEQGLESAKEVRPPNTFEKWVLMAQNRAQSKLSLESPEVAQQTTIRRVLPSFLLVSALVGGVYLYSQHWTRPKQMERFFPNVALSFATIGTLAAINLAVFLAWRMPPFWTALNKYFIIVPAYPYAVSMLGSLFSHQKLTHLLANMLPLFIFGLPLHEDVGRGTFVAIYLASGLLGSLGSLARHSIQRILITTTLGASGCVYGVVAAYLTLHAKYDLFTPDDEESKADTFLQ